MVETKKELPIKAVIGILVGVFGFLFTSIYNGMDMLNAITISAFLAIMGFFYAWFGIQQVSITQVAKFLTDILSIVADKSKEIPAKMLEIELTIKKYLEVLNSSWNALNENGKNALRTASDVISAASGLPGTIGAVAKTAKAALDSLQSNPTPPPAK